MKILFCNPKNNQGTTHSRKGMYPPLGIISIATVLKQNLNKKVDIKVLDEDVEEIDTKSFYEFDLIGFYSTTFNYRQCVKYATIAKNYDVKTLLGGPHPTILAENIMKNQKCFDFIIRYEGEFSCLKLVKSLLNDKKFDLPHIPNLVYKANGRIVSAQQYYQNNLEDVPIPSRKFIRFQLYTDNFKKIYQDKIHIRPGSLYSSKGCSWRDKTGGCVFCARLEKGVRFRSISQIWREIQLLQDHYNVNSIWDISDDNLNNQEWFKNFVEDRPANCKDITFFIYSRVNCIKPGIIKYLKELNVEEVFLGVESGDDRLLKKSFKGQTAKSTLRAVKLLKENDIKYFPSFVLALPGESRESLLNTYNLCQEMANIGGLNRLGCTILQPIPGSPVFDMLYNDSEIGNELRASDDFDMSHLEEHWVNNFTELNYQNVVEYRLKINDLMKDFMVFGRLQDEKS